MKRIKMAAAALAVITVVGAGLAFRSFDVATVYCAATPPLSSAACPSADLINFEVTNGTGVTNPCQTGQLPYQTTSTTCTAYPSGTQFIPTGE